MKTNLVPKNFGLLLLFLTLGLGLPFVVIVMIKGEEAFGGYANIFPTILFLLFIVVNSTTLWKVHIKKQIDSSVLKSNNDVIYVNVLMSQNLLYMLDEWNQTATIAMLLFLIYLFFRAYSNSRFFKRELRKISADSMDFKRYKEIDVDRALKAKMTREHTLSAITVIIAGVVWFAGIGLNLFSSAG